MTPEQRAAAYLTDLVDLALAAGEDGWCPDLAERAKQEPEPGS
jgi:hypothetical protein